MAVKKWRGKWTVDFEVDGKRIRRVSPVQTKRGAREFESRLRLEQATASEADEAEPPPTFADFADEWVVSYAAVHQKPSTQARTQSNLRKHLVPFFGKLRLDEIDSKAVDAFTLEQQKAGLKNGTINIHLSTLHKMLVTAQEWGRIDRVRRMRCLPYEPKEFDWLKPAEIGPLIEAAEALGGCWATFFLVAVRTGLRKGEMHALHWRDVDFEARRLTVRYTLFRGQLGSTKSGKVRVVPLASDACAALRRWRARRPGELVFPREDGRPSWDLKEANAALDKALRRAKLRRVRVHDLRHTFASHLVLQGQSLRVVQILMGHASIRVTERYAHVGDEQLAAAVASLDGLGISGGDEEE